MKHTVTIAPKVDLANHLIVLEEVHKHPSLFDARETETQFAKTVVNLRDKAVRDALICLGWRPPAEPYAPPHVDVRERVRAHDAGTSVTAAERASKFAGKHCEAIAAALNGRDLTVREIAAAIGLTHIQVARRMPEMARGGQVHVVTHMVDGELKDLERDGCRVWRLANK